MNDLTKHSNFDMMAARTMPTKIFRVDVNPSSHGMQIALGLKDRAKKSKDLKNAWKKFVSKFQSGSSNKLDKKSDYEGLERASALSDDGISSMPDESITVSDEMSKDESGASRPESATSNGNKSKTKSDFDGGYLSADSSESRHNKKLYERFNFKSVKANVESNTTDNDFAQKNVNRMQEIKETTESEKSFSQTQSPVNSLNKKPSITGFIPKTLFNAMHQDAIQVNVYSSDDERYSSCGSTESDEEYNLEDMCESGAESIETNSVFFKNVHDRDVIIANLLNHKLSRATLYIMVNDFKEISVIRQKFPTVVPFVLVPGENIEQTRRLLKLLPHMDHFVNFLGQDLALEFLNKRSDFRIKSVSKAYAQRSIIDKIVGPIKQGIIFNVIAGDNSCIDNVVVAGSTATKSFKGSVKKVFNAGASSSSLSGDERAPLLPKNHDAQHSEPAITYDRSDNRQSSGNNIWRYLVSLFYSLCPCINEERVIIPVNEYPIDFDAKLAAAFDNLYKSLEEDWFQKLIKARRAKQNEITQLQNTKEERVEKEYSRLVGVNSDLSSTAANRFEAFANVREFIRVEKEKINQEFDKKTDQLYMEHYDVVVEEQFKMLVSFWKKMRLLP
ncbi:hypothetical protein HA402_003085 [Bradysia odoriphaga]|nr:hypothetical protein HA402_003085 [Bradysia odoriphaga]